MIAVPEATRHWRILRHTGGRPKPIPGQDMQPARFALDMTPDDLHDMCGPGTYRIEALDQYGNRLELVTTVTVGAEPASEEASPALSPPRGYASSDLRVAMETIANMSRTHTDSLRALAMAQADWIKMLATQKALPRGHALPAPQPLEELHRNGFTEDDEEEEEQTKPAWLAALEPVLPAIVSSLVTNPKLRNVNLASILDWRKAAETAKPPNAENEVCATAHVFRVRSGLTPTEQRMFDDVMRDDAASELVALLVNRSEDDAVAYLRSQFKPPTRSFANQLADVTALLTTDEQALVMGILPNLPPEQLEPLKAQLLSVSPTEAVAMIRAFLAPKKAAS